MIYTICIMYNIRRCNDALQLPDGVDGSSFNNGNDNSDDSDDSSDEYGYGNASCIDRNAVVVHLAAATVCSCPTCMSLVFRSREYPHPSQKPWGPRSQNVEERT